MNEDKKRHWYCFSFSGDSADGAGKCTANACTGYLAKGVTLPMIAKNKEYAKVSVDAVLVAVSYLGHMTPTKFKGG